MRLQTAPTGLELSGSKPHYVVRKNGYRTHIPQVPVRLQTAPTGLELSGSKPHYVVRETGYRTHIPQVPVRLQTAPTGPVEIGITDLNT